MTLGTASYRLLPDIQITSPITGDDAHKFQKCFPPGTVNIAKVDGIDTAEIENPRKDTGSREALRHKEFQDKVRLTRVRDHFLFSVESTGVLPSSDIFEMSLDILSEKIATLKQALAELVL